MATATERKFTSLRKRLDQLGYRQPLVVESIPLAEKLFGDLLHTTESLKNAKLQLGKHREQEAVWEAHVEPYREDNARLVGESSELHQQLIRLKEGAEARERDLRGRLRRLDHENADLKFLNTQYVQRLRAQEREAQAKADKILELQEKNFQAVIQTPGGRKKQIPLRRQRMELDHVLPANSAPRSATPLPGAGADPPDPYIADLLQLADQRMAELQSRAEAGASERGRLERALQGLRKQVENREAEIGRLNALLSGGRPPEALAAAGAQEGGEKMVAHLNIQVDFLQQANQELEGRLASALTAKEELEGRTAELGGKNARICSELEEIGALVKQMEAERRSGEEGLRERIGQLESERDRLVAAKGSLEECVRGLEGKGEELREDNQRLAEMLSASDVEAGRAAEALERLSQEKALLQRQLRQPPLERRGQEEEGGRGSPPGAALQGVQRERDRLREALAAFQDELAQIQAEARLLAKDRDNFRLLYEQVNEEVARLRLHSRAPAGSTAALRRLEGAGQEARLEVRQLRAENESLRERLRAQTGSRERELAALEEKGAELELQLAEACREGEAAGQRAAARQEQLASLEEELRGSGAALAAASAESGRLRARASELQGRLEAGQRQAQAQERGLRSRCDREQEAQATVSTLTARVAQLEAALVSREEQLSEVRHALSTLDRDHDTLRADADAKDEAIEELKHKAEEQAAEQGQLVEGGALLRCRLSEVEQRSGGQARELGSLQRQLEEAQTQTGRLRAQTQALIEQVHQLTEDLATMTQENQALHAELGRAVEEREGLQARSQESAQCVLQLQEAIAVKEQQKEELVGSCQALSDQAAQLDSTAKLSLGEASSARMESVSLSQEKQVLEEQLQQSTHEIQQHLAALQDYELQLSSLTHALSKMDTALRQAQEEKKALTGDLVATRELCLRLDSSKEALSRQAAAQAVGYEQLRAELGDLQAELSLTKKQLHAERETNENLQTLLSSERKKEFRAHVAGQEREVEAQHLRQQLTRLEADRLSLVEQLRAARAKAVLASEEGQRWRTELASQTFQKEHARQQLRQLRITRESIHTRSHPTPSPPYSQPTPSPPHSQPTSSPPHSHHTSSPPHSHPTPSPPHSPSFKQEADSLEGGELIARERDSLAKDSARLVGELLASSGPPPSSSPPPPITPPPT